MTKKRPEHESDLLTLARIALAGREQDVQLLLRRLAKKNRITSPQLAEDLLALLKESPTRASPLRRQSDVPLPVDGDSRLQLLRVEEHPVLDMQPLYSESVQTSLGYLVKERKSTDALAKAGLDPTRSALFVGPPGVGKTLAARWIAQQLNKPLLILDLAAVMSSYLGRTGNNLRQVLDYAKSLDCVLLLDELDAIAKRRDDRGEIGELKRLVTVLIQQIDDWPATGLLLAATNHAELLDPAIWRRFESVVDFPLPDEASIAVYVEQMLEPYEPQAIEWGRLLGAAMAGSSYSDIARGISVARRQAAISNAPLEDHLAKLIRVDSLTKQQRIDLTVQLIENGTLSQRKACELTGVARDTIRNRMKPAPKPKTRKRREAA